MTDAFDADKIAKAISERYSNVTISEDDRISDAIVVALEGKDSHHNRQGVMLENIVMIIHRFFNFKKIAIAIRTGDGYEYGKIVGFIKDGQALKISHQSLERIKAIQTETGYCSKANIRIIISNENEKNRRNDCAQDEHANGGLDFENMSDDDMIYVFILTGHKDIKGWIELASPRDGKLPSSHTLHWISLIGDMMVPFIHSGTDAP